MKLLLRGVVASKGGGQAVTIESMQSDSAGLELGTRNHLLVTQSLAARGVITPCAGRLGDHLRAHTKPLVTMRDVEVVFLAGGQREIVPEIRLPLNEIGLAHEYVAMRGDPHLKAMHEEGAFHRVKLVLADQPALAIEGSMTSSALDWQRTFMAVTAIKLTALVDDALLILNELGDLSYLLINRDRVGAILLLDDAEAPPGKCL